MWNIEATEIQAYKENKHCKDPEICYNGETGEKTIAERDPDEASTP